MSRPYYRVHGSDLIGRAKWRRTKPAERGALLTLWTIGSTRSPEGFWRDRAAVVDELDADGFEDAEAVVERLIRLRWLDCDPDGCTVHEWSDWQPTYRGPSDLPEARAAAKRAERAEKAGSPPVDIVTPGDESGSVVTRRDRGEESRGEKKNDVLLAEISPARAREARPERNGSGTVPSRRTVSKTEFDDAAAKWSTYKADEWRPFERAWRDRGLLYPPFGSDRDDPDGSLRARLWQIAEARPADLGRWVQRAPGQHPKEIVDYVFESWSKLRGKVEDALPEPEPVSRGEARAALTKLADLLPSRNGESSPSPDSALTVDEGRDRKSSAGTGRSSPSSPSPDRADSNGSPHIAEGVHRFGHAEGGS